MECPKCHAKNQDGADFCTFCYERFKVKPAAAPPTVIVPRTVVEFGYWETEGPIVATRDAIYFFTTRCTDVSEKKSLKKSVHKNMLNAGLLGAVAGMALSGAFDEKMPLRPTEVHLKTVHWDKDPLTNIAHVKSSVGACDEYFVLEKKELAAIKSKILGRLVFTTKANADITTDGIEQIDALVAFLHSSGYPR